MQFTKSNTIVFSAFFALVILMSACGGESSTTQDDSTSEVKSSTSENSQAVTTAHAEVKTMEEKSVETAEDLTAEKITDEVKEEAKIEPEVKEVKPKVEKKKAPKKRAKMVFDEKLYDYGFVMMGDTVTHDFYFKNVGDDNLVITKVKPSCGCTVPVYPREPIPPGEGGKISVMFKTAGKLGRQVPSIDVYTNYKRKIKIELKGFVDAERAKKPQIKIEEEKEDTTGQ